MKFSEVIGHDSIKSHLIEQANSGRVAHAQLFLGNEGGGNYQMALAFAQFLNCENPTETDSCGVCGNCRKMALHQHPDVSFVFPNAIGPSVKEKPDSAKYANLWRDFLNQNKYFDLGAWCKFIDIEKKSPIINKADSAIINSALNLKAFEGKYKVVLIWLPEKMNLDCSNKILKTLEEPQEHSVIIMVSNQADGLLPTITSRTQITRFAPLPEEQITAALIANGMNEQESKAAAALSYGNYYKAFKEVKSGDNDEANIDSFQTWMRICYKLEINQLNPWIEDMARQTREQQKAFLEYGLRMLRNCTVYNYGEESIARLHPKEAEFLTKFARFIHAGNIVPFMDLFNESHTSISRNANSKIVFMSMSLKICNFLRFKP